MDYNNNSNNTNFNYYPTFDSHSTEILPHQHTQLYNDNSLNPPSTSNDVTRHYTSHDPTIININNQTPNSTNIQNSSDNFTNIKNLSRFSNFYIPFSNNQSQIPI
jgi:hypothetical protein